MKRSLGVGEWVRRGLGAAVLVGVAAIAMGLDTGFLTELSIGSTASLEQGLLDKLHPMPAPASSSAVMPVGAMQGGAMMAAGQDAMMAMKPKSADASVLMKGGGAMMAANPQAMMAANPAMATKAKIEPAAAEALPVEGNAPPLDGRRRMAQLAAADRRSAQGQSRAGRFLDLFLHQLPARNSLCESLGGKVQRSGPRRHRRARAGVRLREERRQRPQGDRRPQNRLSRRRSTTTTRSGAPSTINTGRPIISSTLRVASVTTISAKATMTARRRSSSNCWRRPATKASPPTWSR